MKGFIVNCGERKEKAVNYRKENEKKVIYKTNVLEMEKVGQIGRPARNLIYPILLTI